MPYTCATCGEEHADLPLAYGSHAPDAYFDLPESERESRADLVSDQCVIDGTRFFLRGRLSLPVAGPEADAFFWGVWLEVSREQFERASALWETEGRESEPACACVLATTLPEYPATAGLEVELRTQAVGIRPEVTVLSDHALRHQQRAGITMHRIQQLHDLIAGGGA
jgi:hypothetical protein